MKKKAKHGQSKKKDLKIRRRRKKPNNLAANESAVGVVRDAKPFNFTNKTSQELRMLSPSLFIKGSQCKC